MRYRSTETRIPLDPKRDAQRSVSREVAPQVNPIRSETRTLSEIDGYRPGVFSSESMMHPDMQRVDGWHPSGSYSPSSRNGSDNVHDDAPAYYYRSGRPKLSIATVPVEFHEGAEAGHEDPHGH